MSCPITICLVFTWSTKSLSSLIYLLFTVFWQCLTDCLICYLHVILTFESSIYFNIYSTLALLNHSPSSETQGQSVGPGEKARRKFSSTGGRAPGYRLSQDHFQTVKRMLAPDWAQKMLCIIVPNRRTVSAESFSWVRTRRLLSRHSCPVRSWHLELPNIYEDVIGASVNTCRELKLVFSEKRL